MKAKRWPGYKVFFARKWPEIFLKVGFSRKWIFSKNKAFTFQAGLLMQRFLEVGPGCMPTAQCAP